jgi:hypothetical protein
LNTAIGLQVILGALVTGLSAAIKPEQVSECSLRFIAYTFDFNVPYLYD